MTPMRRFFRGTLLVVVMSAGMPTLADPSVLSPLTGPGDQPPAPWRVMGLPKQHKPFTQFSLVEVDGRRALRVEADNAYGNLVQTLSLSEVPRILRWQWRVETLNTAADLRHKQTDDTTLKVCAFFDQPLKDIQFIERQLLRIARARSKIPLPAATVCYVWDPALPPGTTLENAYTSRVRYVVVTNSAPQEGQWRAEQRDIAEDFLRLFGTETQQLPPLIGVGIGADSDNTHAHSVGYVADLTLAP
jgi:Protein of unknown function (DUF3047)